MATKKSTALPEHIISDENDTIARQAKNAQDEREKVNYHTGEEKEWKEKICVNSGALREKLANNDTIIGKITIAPDNQTASRVEFRINNGSLDVSEMDNLDKLFGAARPELFEQIKIVDTITDPEALVQSLRDAGLDPWDYLKINVKANMDQILIDKGEGFNTAEAILPLKGLLSKLPDLIKRFSEEAKTYIRSYLKQALNPTVVLGTKAKK